MRKHLAKDDTLPSQRPPWQTLLVLASERCEFFAHQQQLGVTPETTGTATARLFGGVVGEVQLQGAHLAVVSWNCSR